MEVVASLNHKDPASSAISLSAASIVELSHRLGVRCNSATFMLPSYRIRPSPPGQIHEKRAETKKARVRVKMPWVMLVVKPALFK